MEVRRVDLKLPSLFFDLDGTLTDPAPGITACIRHAFDALGHTLQGDLERFIGPPLQESFAEVLGADDPDLVTEAIRLYRERFSTVGLFENDVFEGIPEVLLELEREGYTLRVVTSKPTVYADRIIDHFGLRPFFPVVYGSELSGVRTDKRHLLEYVLNIERPTRALMIGDRRHDVAGAKAHGLDTLGVLWGYGSEAELQDAGADQVIETVAELPEAVRAFRSTPKRA